MATTEKTIPRECCPHCATPMQTYVLAKHVLHNARVDSYCPSCALVTGKTIEEASTASP